MREEILNVDIFVVKVDTSWHSNRKANVKCVFSDPENPYNRILWEKFFCHIGGRCVLSVIPNPQFTLDELTLQDVVYLYHWDRQQPLQIYFTLIRSADEEDPPPVLDAEEMPTINTEQLGDTETKNSHLSNSEKCKSPSLQIPNLSIQLPPNSFNEGIINYPIITTVEVERTVSSDTRSPVPRKKRNTNSTRNVLKKTEQQSEELTLMSSTHINSDSVNASESKVAPLITTASELSSSTSRIRDSTTNSNGKQYQKLQKTDAAAAKSAQNNSPSRKSYGSKY